MYDHVLCPVCLGIGCCDSRPWLTKDDALPENISVDFQETLVGTVLSYR